MLIALFFGYEPPKALIGMAFLQAALSFLIMEAE
jgi:hypothetical protein